MTIDLIQFGLNALLFFFALRFLQTKIKSDSDMGKAIAFLFH